MQVLNLAPVLGPKASIRLHRDTHTDQKIIPMRQKKWLVQTGRIWASHNLRIQWGSKMDPPSLAPHHVDTISHFTCTHYSTQSSGSHSYFQMHTTAVSDSRDTALYLASSLSLSWRVLGTLPRNEGVVRYIDGRLLVEGRKISSVTCWMEAAGISILCPKYTRRQGPVQAADPRVVCGSAPGPCTNNAGVVRAPLHRARQVEDI